MKYREEVEGYSLGEAGKRRVSAAVMQGLEGTARRPTVWKRVLAACLSLVLVAAVVLPSVLLTARRTGDGGNGMMNSVGDSGSSDIGPSVPDTPEIGDGDHSTGDSGEQGSAPTDPVGVGGGFTDDYQVRYGAGETIRLTCKVLAAHAVSEPIPEGNGFTAISVKLISQRSDSRGRVQSRPDGSHVLWTEDANEREYTYEVELMATGEGTSLSFALTFETDNARSLRCEFWGYRPSEGKHAGEVFCSHLSRDSAFLAYLGYMLNAGEIEKWQYDEMLAAYWNSNGAVIEKSWVE